MFTRQRLNMQHVSNIPNCKLGQLYQNTSAFLGVFRGKKCTAIFYEANVGYLGQTSTAHVLWMEHESKVQAMECVTYNTEVESERFPRTKMSKKDTHTHTQTKSLQSKITFNHLLKSMNSTQPSQKYSVTLQRFSPIFLKCSKPQLETKKTDAMVREQRPIACFFFFR